MIQDKTIQLTLVYLGESHRIQTDTTTYYSLITLISDHLSIPGFGLCCGMGSCGTCRIQLDDSYYSVKRQVLACGVPVNDALSNTCIFIPENTY
jgi:aerobic-type carbon monoxide dehydrogenase small subunit (CoxS/CutS family)